MANDTTLDQETSDIFPLRKWQTVILLVFDCLLIVTITIGNILVVFSVFLERKLRSPTNAFIASLAVADLTVGLIVIPIDITFALGYGTDVTTFACLASSTVLTVMIIVSILHLTVIAYDRYLAITDPLCYIINMSRLKVGVLISVAWGIALTISSMPLLGWNNLDHYNHNYCDLMFVHAPSYRIFTVAVSVIIPQNLMLYFYFKMFRVAKKHLNRIAAQEQTTLRRPTLRRDVKAAKTVAVILGFFLIAWIPASVISVIDIFIRVDEQFQEKLFIYELAFFHIAFSNSMVNPVIYAFRNKEFRHSFLKIIGTIFQCECWRQRVLAAGRVVDASCYPEVPSEQLARHKMRYPEQ